MSAKATERPTARDFDMRLGDRGRLPDGSVGVVVRAKSGTSPARWLAHQETARRNVEALEEAKHKDRSAYDADAVTVSFFVALDDEWASYIRSMYS